MCAHHVWTGTVTLQWLREGQDPPYPWNSIACCMAAEKGHLHVRSQNPPCPRDADIVVEAARDEGHENVVQWVLAQDPPPSPAHEDEEVEAEVEGDNNEEDDDEEEEL